MFMIKLEELENKIDSTISTVKAFDSAINSLKEVSQKQGESIDKFIKSSEDNEKHYPLKTENHIIGEDTIEFNQPSIRELIEWGKKYSYKNCEEMYFTGLGYIANTPYHLAPVLEDAGIDFEKVLPHELLYLIISNDIELFKRMLEITLEINSKTMSEFGLYKNNIDDSIVIYDSQNEIGITKEIHKKLYEFVVNTYGFEDTINKKFESEAAKKIYISHQRLKFFKDKDRGYTKHLAWVVGDNIKDIENIEDCHDVLDIPIGEYYKKYRKDNKAK